MPFTREALDHSVTTLVRETREVPDFKVGYQEWRNACGGVYTISVADAIEVAETAFRQNLGCSSSAHQMGKRAHVSTSRSAAVVIGALSVFRTLNLNGVYTTYI